MPPVPDSPWVQLFWLLILAIPVATIARTVIFEEIFHEAREWCKFKSEHCRTLFSRKFFYVFTCEYCFSHWVALLFLLVTGFRLLIDDWRGSIIAWFGLVFVANIYLNLYSRLRVDITSEKKQIEKIETEIEQTRTQEATGGSAVPTSAHGAEHGARS